MKRLKRDQRGISNIIVVVLGLVIVIVIVSNVVLWSYEMNQLDWEKLKEDITILEVSPVIVESWTDNPAGYTVGGSTSWVSGSITDLMTDDDSYLTFRSYYSETDTADFVDNNTADVHVCEVEFTGASNTEEWNQLNWTVNSAWTASAINVTLQLYNYTLGGYPTSGGGYLVYTSDSTPSTEETRSQTITVTPTHFRNATGYWKLKLRGVGATPFDLSAEWIEVTAMRAGTQFTFKNVGAPTAHLVSLWVNNATYHDRYDLSLYLNSGDTKTYLREDIGFPAIPYVVKVVTEKGNIAIYADS